MLPSLTLRLARLLRWPRRIAALLCLLLAAATAGRTGPRPAARQAPTPVTARLQSGQVAVPVPVRRDAAAYLRVGQRVSLFATSDGSAPAAGGSVGDELLVLALPPPADEQAETATVVVAAERTVATRIATHANLPFLAVLDKYP
jgi:hypothetical protein